MQIKRMLLLTVAMALLGLATRAQNLISDLMTRTDLPLAEVERLAEEYFQRVGKQKGTGYKQFQRWLFERKFHSDSRGYFINATTEMAEFNRVVPYMQSAFASNPTAIFGTWTELGPKQWNRTTGWNPGVGRLTAMAIHPSNLAVIYVGSPGGGMWKTTNTGATWTPMSDANNAWMHIFALAIDPNNQNIVYAGTGNSANLLLKSTNAGASWAATGAGPGGEIRRIIINPSNSNIVLCAASNGIWRSTNAGTSWTQVHTGSKEDLEFNPSNPNIVYASGNDVFRSTDNGVTWAAVGAGAGITNTGRCLIGVSPANANYVYIVQANGSIFGRMYRSTNSGVSFTTTVTGNSAAGTQYFGYSVTGNDNQGQAWYDMAICVSNTNVNDVYIGGILIWKSTDAAVSFTAQTEWLLPNSTGYTHPDMHGLHAVGSNIYSLSDGGIYRSTDFGANWTDLTTGMGIRQFYRMANSKTNATIITGGAQDNGSSVLTATGWKDWLGADGMEGLVSPTNANNLWGTSQGGALYKSTNQGASYSGVSPGASGPWVTDLAIDPTNENIVYGGWNGGVRRTTNGGGAWTNISSAFFTGATNDLTVAPSNGNTIYASVGATIWVTTNGGTTWVARTSPGGSVNDLCVSPTNPNKIWVAAGSTVQVSTNGGVSFTNITTGLPSMAARSVVVDNFSNEGVYVAMNIGIYYRNNSTGWTNGTGNLPLVACNELEIQASSGKLRVATYGRGVWETDLVAAHDLYIKDRPADNGTEPFIEPNGIYWASEDIWIRNTNDNLTGHQNPICGTTNYIYVRVRNKNSAASPGTEQLKVYWAKASSALGWPNPWNGGVFNCSPPALMGTQVGAAQTIPSVAGLGSTVRVFAWTPPPPSSYACFGSDQFHFCLLARIENTPVYPHGMTFPELTGNLGYNVKQNNNVAWKNVTVATSASCFRMARAEDAAAPTKQHFTMVLVEGEKFSGIKTSPASLRVSIEKDRLVAHEQLVQAEEGAAAIGIGVDPIDQQADIAFVDENEVQYQAINKGGVPIMDYAWVDVKLGHFLKKWSGAGKDIMKFEEKDERGEVITWVRLLTPNASIDGIDVASDDQATITVRITQVKDLADPAQHAFDFDITLFNGEGEPIGGNNFRADLLPTMAKTGSALARGGTVIGTEGAQPVAVSAITTSAIKLTTQITDRFNVVLMNASGQVMRRGDFAGHTEVDIKDLPKGIYYLRLLNNRTKETSVKKIALQ